MSAGHGLLARLVSGRGDGLAVRGPPTVHEHGNTGREQGGDGDQGDLPAGHAAGDYGVDPGTGRRHGGCLFQPGGRGGNGWASAAGAAAANASRAPASPARAAVRRRTGFMTSSLLSLDSWDSGRQMCWFSQEIPSGDAAIDWEPTDQVFWENYWDCRHCSYAARTGDQRSVIKCSDFYSVRQWHSTAMYTDRDRLLGLEHCLMVCLPRALPPTAGPGRYVRLTLGRGPGADFSERDRAVLTLLGPHLDQAYLACEQRRHPVALLTPRQNDLLRLVAAGHTNTQIARHLGISQGTVRTHLETSTNGCTSPTAPAPSPAPSPTGLPRAHQQSEGGLS